MIEFRKTVLDNGLRIIVAPQEDNPAVTISVLVETGSKYENKDNNGISHFLEHMVFKGTEKRPKAIDISYELDSIGAAYNAFTWYEMTGYWAKVARKHLDIALDVVSDIYLSQVFDEKEIEKERGPITEEYNMIEDTPARKVHINFANLLYGDQPAGWPVGGPKENIKKIMRDDLIAYKKDHYVAEATVVVVAGSVDEDEVVEKIKEYFKNIPTGKKVGKVAVDDSQDGPALKIEKKDSDQVHMCLGVRAFKATDDRAFAIGVLGTILGSGASSRLFDKVREEMGAVYYIGDRIVSLSDHGSFYVSAGCGKDKLEEVIKAILAEFKKLKEEKVGEKELKKAKDYIVGRMMLSLETSDDVADFYGNQESMHEEILTPEEQAKRFQEVTADEIMDIAKEIFVNERLNLSLVGPIDESESLKSILKID